MSAWTRIFRRNLAAITRKAARLYSPALRAGLSSSLAKSRRPAGEDAWIGGLAVGSMGAKRFKLYRPPRVESEERLPLMVMLHGCRQDADSFAASTRMNRIARRDRFFVLYPEQDRMANGQGCWNWFDTSTGRAYGEASLILKAIDQVCRLYPVDHERIAVAGLSAGASMAGLLGARQPTRFKAVVMHSGIAPGTAHSPYSAVVAMRGQRVTKELTDVAPADATSWPALLVIHGDADTVVSPQNGEAAVEAWANAVGAKPGAARSVQRGGRYPMRVTDYKRHGSTAAILVQVSHLAHAWSGGAANKPYGDALGPDASRMAWSFASRQFRP